MNFDTLPQEIATPALEEREEGIRWGRLDNPHYANAYGTEVTTFLSSIHPLTHIPFCNSASCQDHDHIAELVSLYSDIVKVMKQAGRRLCGSSRHVARQRMGWNDLVKDIHHIAREAFLH